MLCGMATESAQRFRTGRTLVSITALAALAGAHLSGWFSGLGGLSTAVTVVSTAAGLCLLLYWPGRLLADFLSLSILSGAAAGALLSLALSLGVSPPVLDLIWNITHQGWLVLVMWWVLLCGLALCRHLRPSPSPGEEPLTTLLEGRGARVFATLLAVWLVGCILLTYWPTERGGCPIAANPHDYVKHHAVLASLHSDGLPLGNPFCAEVAHQPYYYYHYFYLPPATVRLWTAGRLSIAAAFAWFAAAAALACVGLIYLLTKRLTGGDAPAAFAAAAASLIGGLDVIPLALKGQLVITLDAWADQAFRIHNFYTSYLWCPQHVLGLVVLLLGALLLSAAPRARWWLFLGPLLVASLTGATVYLAVAVLLTLGLYALIDLLGPGSAASSRPRRLGAWLIVALLGFLLMSPQLAGYAEMSSRYESNLTTTWPANSWALPGRLVAPGPLANLLDLPWRLLLEFGAGFLACLLVGRAVYRRLWNDQGLRLLLIASLVGLALCALFRSDVHRFDYGFKIALYPAQALGAILCGCLLDAATRTSRWNPLGWRLRSDYCGRWRTIVGALMLAAVLIGLPVGFYEAPLAAARRLVLPADRTWLAERRAYRYLRDELPADAVVQTHTGTSRAPLVQMVERQWGVLDPRNSDVGVFRPPDPSVLEAARRDVVQAGQTASAAQAQEWLQAHRITHVFVGLQERERWEHLDKFQEARYFTPVFRDDSVAVYALVTGAPADRPLVE